MPDFLMNLFVASAQVHYSDPFIPEWEIRDFPEGR